MRPAYAAEPDPPAGATSPVSSDTSPTVVRELTEKRTETATSYLLSDGTVRAEITEAPTRFQDASGAWAPIVTDLVPGDSPGEVITASTSMTVSFNTQDPERDPATLTGSGYEVGLDMLGATEGMRLVYGDKTRYVGVARDTDLEYQAMRTGVKETVVLGSADAPSSFEFALDPDGLQVLEGPLGGYGLYRPGMSEPELGLGSLVVFDSSVNAAGDPASCPETTMTVTTAADGTAVVAYEISPAWLSDPARVFPVMVDPTLTSDKDTYVTSAEPGTSHGTLTELRCGYEDSASGHNRADVHFDTTSIPAGAYVNDARFKIRQSYQYYMYRYKTTHLGRLKGTFASTTTWNSQGSVIGDPGTKVDMVQSQDVYGRDVDVVWPVDTIVKGWVDAPASNTGFMLYQSETSAENGLDGYRKFRSSEYSVAAERPTLTVVYSVPSVAGASGVDKTVYRIGDTVTAKVRIATGIPEDVNCIQANVNLVADDDTTADRRGTFQWTRTAPTGWNQSTSLGTGLGYVSSLDSAPGASAVTFLPSSCSIVVDTPNNFAEATFKWKINSNYGDIQNNDINVIFKMDPLDANNDGNRWTSPTTKVDTDFDIAPAPITALTQTKTPSTGWFREVDRNADGASDTPNDKPDQGRGSVDLGWTASPLADGYRVYAWDGSNYRKVGETLSNSATSWSSAGARLFPKDSTYATRTADSWTADPYVGAAPLASALRAVTIPVTAKGAGVVVSDGTSLYCRAWSTYPGPTKWKRMGTGLNGTTAGADLGDVGPDFATRPILSAFHLDGVIYNGCALTSRTIEGVPVSAADGATGTRTLTFSQPLLDRTTGSPLSGASGNVQLAATDERIYSVAYNRTAGDTKNGFRIREYDRNGTFIADHDIVCTSFLADGLIADGDNLYFTEWGGANRVAKVSTSSWKVTNQFASGWMGATNEINGCYDAANDVFWTGALDSGHIYRYPGPGLDLRDSAKGLYEKTDGEGYDTASNYWFRVVPYSEVMELPVGDNYCATPTFDNRTVRVNDDPRHTTAELGMMDGHDAAVALDKGALELDVTDLQIASWGPSAALTRHYSSGDTAAGAYAPGWHFDFEQSLALSSNIATYTDESGGTHRFTRDPVTGVWLSGNGAYDTLAPSGSNWTITRKDRSVLTFSATGRLMSEADANGNAVTYTWSANNTHLAIAAANGQSIQAEFNSAGDILYATYATADGERRVEYNDGEGYQSGITTAVRSLNSDPELDQLASYTYDVGSAPAYGLRIEEISEPHFVAAGPYGANWGFAYDSADRLSQVRWPGYGSGSEEIRRRSDLSYNATARTATVSSWAEVKGADTPVEQLYQYNPTGTESWHSNKRTAGTPALDKWSYTYDPQNETASELSPEGVTTRTDYDSRGNATHEFDGEGGMTANVYDANNDVIRSTSPAGRTTYSTYDADGNLTAEEKVLTAAGERSRTTYAYDTQGRGLLVKESKRIDATNWAVTDYVESSFAPNGEAQTSIERGVKLSPTANPVDLTTTKSFDAFGNLKWEKNARSEWVTKDNAYDIAGRLLSSTDASGVITHHAYDVLGFESETSRTAGSSWADWKRMVHTADGWLYEETYLDKQNGQPVAVRTDRHSFDAAGNETDVQTPEGTTALVYDAQGQATSRTVPGVADAAETLYDDDGNVTSEKAPANADPDTYEYDDNGEVTTETPAGAEATVHAFDEDGNETATYEPLQGSGAAISTSEYDVGGRMVKSTDEKGFVTTVAYDQLDRQLAATSGGPASTKVYNSLGWVLKETDPDGQEKTYTYDQAGRVTAETLSGKVTSRTYDATGRELSRTRPDASSIAFAYDAMGRLESETHSKAGQPVRNWVHSYDALGHDIATTETVAGVTTTLAWIGDSPSRVSKRYGSLSTTVTLAAGAETGLSVRATGSPVIATRSVSATDTAGRTIRYDINAGTTKAQSLVYDGTGKLVVQGGAGLGTGGIGYGYSPETARQSFENIDLAYPATLADHNRTFGYDAAGRLTTATDTVGPNYSFTYSADGKITGNGSRAFAYDATGRLATMTVAGVATTYTNDTRGRRTGHTSPTEVVVYSYDDADHLTGLTRDVGKNGTIEKSASYTYDARGQRTHSIVTSGSVTTTTTYVYDGLTLLSAVSVTGSATTSVDYVNDSAGRPVAAYVSVPGTTAPVFVWIVTDQRGDVLELLDSGGEALVYHAYTPYGEAPSTGARAVGSVTAAVAASVRDAVKLRFAGYSWDDESGLYYCSQRYYDPVTCQWLTKDPARADGEESAYQYCGGDPVGAVDPTGEATVAVAVVGFTFVLVYAILVVYQVSYNNSTVYSGSGINWSAAWWRGYNWGDNRLFSHAMDDIGGGYRVGAKPEAHNGGKTHVHWKDGSKKNAVNKDGTARHGNKPPKKVKNHINKKFGWKLD